MIAEQGQLATEPEQLDDPESGWTWFLMLVSFVLLTITIVAVAVVFFSFQGREGRAKVIDRPAEQLSTLRSSQEALLQEYESYQVVPMGGTEADAETKIRIPIERAMELTVSTPPQPQPQPQASAPAGEEAPLVMAEPGTGGEQR